MIKIFVIFRLDIMLQKKMVLIMSTHVGSFAKQVMKEKRNRHWPV